MACVPLGDLRLTPTAGQGVGEDLGDRAGLGGDGTGIVGDGCRSSWVVDGRGDGEVARRHGTKLKLALQVGLPRPGLTWVPRGRYTGQAAARSKNPWSNFLSIKI